MRLPALEPSYLLPHASLFPRSEACPQLACYTHSEQTLALTNMKMVDSDVSPMSPRCLPAGSRGSDRCGAVRSPYWLFNALRVVNACKRGC